MVKKNIQKKLQKKEPLKKSKKSRNFVKVLSIFSIIGFLAIISKSLFEFDLALFAEALMLLIFGIAFILESDPKVLFKSSKKDGLEDKRNFPRFITFTIGCLAVILGILSSPFINLEHFLFLSFKGILSIIAIIFIVVQTWLVKNNSV